MTHAIPIVPGDSDRSWGFRRGVGLELELAYWSLLSTDKQLVFDDIPVLGFGNLSGRDEAEQFLCDHHSLPTMLFRFSPGVRRAPWRKRACPACNGKHRCAVSGMGHHTETGSSLISLGNRGVTAGRARRRRVSCPVKDREWFLKMPKYLSLSYRWVIVTKRCGIPIALRQVGGSTRYCPG